jgi:hypothetical protein
MISLTWTRLGTSAFTVAAGPVDAPWLVAHEDLIGAMTHLKLKARGAWTPLAGLPECGPDGLMGQSFPEDRLLLKDCPLGALIGRIGGSSATLKVTEVAADSGEGKPFAIGCHAVIKLPDKVVGPLYLGFNVPVRPLVLKSLEVEIFAGG